MSWLPELLSIALLNGDGAGQELEGQTLRAPQRPPPTPQHDGVGALVAGARAPYFARQRNHHGCRRCFHLHVHLPQPEPRLHLSREWTFQSRTRKSRAEILSLGATLIRSHCAPYRFAKFHRRHAAAEQRAWRTMQIQKPWQRQERCVRELSCYFALLQPPRMSRMTHIISGLCFASAPEPSSSSSILLLSSLRSLRLQVGIFCHQFS